MNFQDVNPETLAKTWNWTQNHVTRFLILSSKNNPYLTPKWPYFISPPSTFVYKSRSQYYNCIRNPISGIKYILKKSGKKFLMPRVLKKPKTILVS